MPKQYPQSVEEVENAATAGAARPPDSARDRRVLRCNVLCFLLSGTIICFWVWRNTDWFEELAALLGLSGVLSWAAVVLKIVPEDRSKKFQEAFFVALFENSKACPWLVLSTILIAAAPLCFATIQLEPLQETADRAVMVYRATEAKDALARLDEDDFDTLKPGGRLRTVVWVTPFVKARFIVKVSGYPDKLITLGSWERKELVVPNSFRRPVVLLRPTERLMNNGRQSPWKLVVRTGNPSTTFEMPFDGHAVWFGCDGNVEVPRNMQDLWESELAPLLKPYWSFPQALSSVHLELSPGQPFEVQLRAANGVLQPAVTNFVDRVAPRPGFFPQIVKIDSAN